MKDVTPDVLAKMSAFDLLEAILFSADLGHTPRITVKRMNGERVRITFSVVAVNKVN